jgi:HEAT repeat protein
MEALVRIGDHESLESLIYALNNDRRVYDRELVAKALGKSSDPMVIEPLIQALFNHKKNFVRASAAEALGNLEDPRIIESLIQALKGPLEVSKVVAEVLGRKGDVRAIEPLLQRLYGVVSWYHDWRLNRPVGIWPSEVNNTLMGLKKLEKKIMEVLIKFGSSAVEYIIPALKNEEIFVRSTAIEALGRIGDTRAVTPLIQALDDEDRNVRKSAAEALGEIKDVKALEPLIRLLNDPNRLRNVPTSIVKDAIKKINSPLENIDKI